MPRKPTEFGLTYRDSANPGVIELRIRDGGDMMWSRHRLTVVEAAALSQQLAEAVRAEGYELVARKRS